MHNTSLWKMKAFVDTYLSEFTDSDLEILDFGSQTVDAQGSSYRSLFWSSRWNYRGLDITDGENVDIVVADPFDWRSIASDSADVVVSGQAFEHVDYFWVSAFEIARVLKPGGVAAIVAPSSGPEHRYPLDCWRYYRDGLVALCAYIDFELLDAFTDWNRETWADSMLVMRKPQWDSDGRGRFEERLAHQKAVLQPSSYPPSSGQVPVPASSPLSRLTGGQLEPVLEQLRYDALAQAQAGGSPTRRLAKSIAGTRGIKWYRKLRYHS